MVQYATRTELIEECIKKFLWELKEQRRLRKIKDAIAKSKFSDGGKVTRRKKVHYMDGILYDVEDKRGNITRFKLGPIHNEGRYKKVKVTIDHRFGLEGVSYEDVVERLDDVYDRVESLEKELEE